MSSVRMLPTRSSMNSLKVSVGRIGGLGDVTGGDWRPMDLFRFSASGQHDYQDGRDGVTTYFSYDDGSTTSQSAGLSFNNRYSGSTEVNTNDIADFTEQERLAQAVWAKPIVSLKPICRCWRRWGAIRLSRNFLTAPATSTSGSYQTASGRRARSPVRFPPAIRSPGQAISPATAQRHPVAKPDHRRHPGMADQ